MTRLVPSAKGGRISLKPRFLQRISVLAVVLGAIVVGLGVGPATAHAAKKPCWKVVIDDWWDGRIDGIYSVACMRAAIKNAPEDLTQYSDLPSDISRALAERPKVKAPDDHVYVTPASDQIGRRQAKRLDDRQQRDKQQQVAAPPASGPGDGGGSGPVPSAIAAGADDPSSLPIPLIALGALALLLLASGATGLVARRVRAHRSTSAGAAADS
jgi:hypothetical protein